MSARVAALVHALERFNLTDAAGLLHYFTAFTAFEA
jgi:hypothetical protein